MKQHATGFSVIALIVCSVIFFSACGTPALPPTTTSNSMPESVTVCLYTDVTTLDIRVQTTRNLRSIVGNIHDTLVAARGPNMTLVPQLATSWENIDHLTWRLHLRQGVSFTNGEPFNAEAVKYSIESTKAGKGGVRTYVAAIDEVRIIDDYTVDLVTAEPNVVAIRNLTAVAMYPPKYGQEVDDKFSEQPIGTGPFKFVEWVKGDHITLEANPDFWDKSIWNGPSPVDKVIFRICPEASTRVAMLQTGEVDLIDNILPELIPQIDGKNGNRVLKFTGYKRILLHIDARQDSAPPLNDVRVRKALNYALDRDSIIKNLLGGYATQYGGFVHTGIPTVNPDLKPYPYDPEKAKELLAEAGLPNGFEVNLYTPVGTYLKGVEVSEAIQSQLDSVGIKVNLVPMENADYNAQLGEKALKGLIFDRRLVNTGDPIDSYLYMLYSQGGLPLIPDPKFDGMLAESNAMFDQEQRYEYLKNTVEPYIWNEMVPEVTLYDLVDTYGLSSRLIWHPVNLQEQIDLRGLGHSDWLKVDSK